MAALPARALGSSLRHVKMCLKNTKNVLQGTAPQEYAAPDDRVTRLLNPEAMHDSRRLLPA